MAVTISCKLSSSCSLPDKPFCVRIIKIGRIACTSGWTDANSDESVGELYLRHEFIVVTLLLNQLPHLQATTSHSHYVSKETTGTMRCV